MPEGEFSKYTPHSPAKGELHGAKVSPGYKFNLSQYLLTMFLRPLWVSTRDLSLLSLFSCLLSSLQSFLKERNKTAICSFEVYSQKSLCYFNALVRYSLPTTPVSFIIRALFIAAITIQDNNKAF